jgi:hypothetical protein
MELNNTSEVVELAIGWKELAGSDQNHLKHIQNFVDLSDRPHSKQAKNCHAACRQDVYNGRLKKLNDERV